ncbi:MAG: hypothetical protein IT436_18080 [Phycisphaerales bacterium]|nr:hypothetical protein [Phycisphaerales bacterium]
MPFQLNWPIGMILASMLAAGIAFMLAGRRGRRLNDHPICRACGFDLIGLPPPTSQPARCPECGADLSARRAIGTGLRRRRPWLAAAGLVVAIIPSAVFGWAIYRQARAYDWNRAKPAAMLIWELRRAESAGNPGQGAARARPGVRDRLDELIRRAERDRLSESHYEALAPMARQRQADRSMPWDPRWGRLVERGFDAGKISEQEFNRYLEGVIAGTFEVRPVVRAGRPVPARLSIEARAGPLSWVGFSGERVSLTVAGRDQRDIGGRLLRTGATSEGDGRGWPGAKYLGERFRPSLDVIDITSTGRMAAREDWAPVLAPQEPGLYTITTKWRFSIQRPIVPKSSPSGEAARRRTFEREFTRTFTVMPAGEPTVKLIAPPESDGDEPGRKLEQGLREVFRVQRFDPRMLNGVFRTDHAPCPYAFEVYAAMEGTEVRLGSLVPIPDDPFDELDTRQFLLDVPAPLGGVEYILRPSIEAAELTVDLSEIWGGEIRIRESGPLPNLLR